MHRFPKDRESLSSLCTYSASALTLGWYLPNLSYVTGRVCGFKPSVSADVDCKPGKTTTLGLNTGLALKWQAAHNSLVTWFFLSCHDKADWTIPVCVWGGHPTKPNTFWLVKDRLCNRFCKKVWFFSLGLVILKKNDVNKCEWPFISGSKEEDVREQQVNITHRKGTLQHYYSKVTKNTWKCREILLQVRKTLTIIAPDTEDGCHSLVTPVEHCLHYTLRTMEEVATCWYFLEVQDKYMTTFSIKIFYWV